MFPGNVITVNAILFCVGTILGHNVDTDYPIVYSYQEIRRSQRVSIGETEVESYFGYDVSLHTDPRTNRSRIFIGAPRGSPANSTRGGNREESGLLFWCFVPGDCTEKTPIEHPSAGNKRRGLHIVAKNDHTWFGATIAIDRSSDTITVCAPRLILVIVDVLKREFYTMQGLCYSGPVANVSLSAEEDQIAGYNFSKSLWYNPLHGFSAHYARLPVGRNSPGKYDNRIIGEPTHEIVGTVSIKVPNKQPLSVEQPVYDSMSHFGYSVTSGYYFGKTLMYAGAAPGWHYVGQVVIISPPPASKLIVAQIQGSDLGEYFGGSLATGDLNGDGLDDLIVGAPYWGEDNGKVYIYWGETGEGFRSFDTIRGMVNGARFGYATTCGDLNADGFADLVVGAPWEEDGVVYVYNGAKHMAGQERIEWSQRISALAMDLGISGRIKGFGFSLSDPIDIDRNGYPDLGVGAYKSGQAIVLRSKPVTRTKLVMEVTPDTLEREAKQFLVKLCPEYSVYDGVSKNQGTKITLTIDELLKRTTETFLQVNSVYSPDNCVNVTVHISEHVRDYIEPISIVARQDFVYNRTNDFCKTCPIEERENGLNVAQTLVPFDIKCGEDKICIANISVTTKFHGVRENDAWIVGSNDISFEANITNHGEPSYLTTANFTFPEGVMLRSILPFCQESTATDDLVVICDVGNPLGENEQKTIRLELDMKHLINVSPNETLRFQVEVDSRSTNQGTRNVTKSLGLMNEASLSLTGKTVEDSDDLPLLSSETPNITFHHSYQIYKRGATPITKASLIVNVPGKVPGSDPLVRLYRPQLLVSGKYYECSSDDANFLENPDEEPWRQSDGENSDPIITNETDPWSIHELAKRDVNFTQEKSEIDAGVVHMNCSDDTANCYTIVCDVSAVKTLADIGKLSMKFSLNVDRLNGDFDKESGILKFVTRAHVRILEPENPLAVNGTRDTTDVVTTFYNKPKVQKLQTWIVLLSISIGLLLLLVFIGILSKLGFFNRKAKQDLAALIDKEVTENSGNAEDPSVSKTEDT